MTRVTHIIHRFRSFAPLGLACLTLIAATPAPLRAQITGPGVYAWGDNGSGELGNGNSTWSSTPVQVLGLGGSGYLSNVTAVAGGGFHSLALTGTGNVYAWGYNPNGELGNGTTTDSSTPVQVLGVGQSGHLSNITSMVGGCYHSLALASSGNVYAWGYNTYGQLGNGTTSNSSTPIQVLGVGGSGYLSNVTAVAGGYYHSLTLSSTGNVYAWGHNQYGQLGNGTTTDSSTPVEVLGVGGSGNLSNVTALAAGVWHSLALANTGNLYAWGANFDGQLGNGTTTDSHTPVEILGVDGSGYLSNVTAVAGGWNFSLALTSTGNVYAWGANNDGQLGNGTTTNSSTPLLVSLPANGSAKVVAVSAGWEDSFALESDGSLWAWGYNDGEYGNGTTTQSLTPIEVYSPSGGLGISAFAEESGDTSLAVVTPEPSCLFLLIGIAGLVRMRPRRRTCPSRGE